MQWIDRCSFPHIFAGALFGFLGALVLSGWWSLLLNVGLAVFWEVLEMSYAYQKWWNGLSNKLKTNLSGETVEVYTGDTVVQAVSDIVLHSAASAATVATFVDAGEQAALVVAASIMGASAAIYSACAIFGWLPVHNKSVGCCGTSWADDWSKQSGAEPLMLSI